ncbi:MAG: hypothetical protein ACLT98_17725 [Eggerthellaceae bacterium]
MTRTLAALACSVFAGRYARRFGRGEPGGRESKPTIRFQPESIDLDPDFIRHSMTTAARRAGAQTRSPRVSNASAVQNDRYIVLDPNLFLYKPNANWAQAYETLAGHLYGAGGNA